MNERYVCVPLTSDRKNLEKIREFTIDREQSFSHIPDGVYGLEAYLKRCAWAEDLNNETRIYLIVDAELNEIAAYFGLKAGMIASAKDGMPTLEMQRSILEQHHKKMIPEVLPGIEISHFAVNDNYRRRAGHGERPIRGLGEYFYPAFIYPIIEEVAARIGVNMIYLYAAGDEPLIRYYERVFDFQSLDHEDCYIPLEPYYDNGCTFMYKLL